MLKLIALVVPLGLDTFAVSAALAIGGLSGPARARLGLLFALFEGVMPLVGLALGALLSGLLGAVAEWAAIVVLIAVGLWMLVSRDEDDVAAERLMGTRGVTALGLALSVSLDELAIGFTIGLLHVPVVLAVLLIALQALAVSQLGFRLGARVGEAVREGAERLAGAVLVLLGLGLGVARLAGVDL